MSNKSPGKEGEQSRGNSPQDQSAGTNIYKQAKNLFTKKFSLKLGSKDVANSKNISPPKSSEMNGAGKVNKFKSSIPGKTITSHNHSGMAFYPGGSQSPTTHTTGKTMLSGTQGMNAQSTSNLNANKKMLISGSGRQSPNLNQS